MSRPIAFRQRLAQNTVASIATNVWTIVLTIGSLPIVLHGLGVAPFGVWIFLQTFSATNGWLSIPANGLSVSATRSVASADTEAGPEAQHRAVSATMTSFCLAGAAFGGLLAVAAPPIIDAVLDLGDISTTTLRILSAAFGVQVAGEFLSLAITSILEGLQEVALARSVDALRKTAVAVATAWVATSGGGLRGVGIASAGAVLVVTTAAGLLLQRRRQIGFARPHRRDLASVIGYAGTVSVLQATGVVHRTMDKTIVGATFGPSAIALVEIATQIQAGSTALLSSSTYPVIATAPWLRSRGDDLALRRLLERTTRYSVLLTLPIIAAIVVFAGPFIRLWVGAEYGEAVGLTQMAVLYVGIAAPLQAGSNLLLGFGEAGAVLRASAISVLANLVASLVLVHVVGIVGVFVGTIVGTVVLIPFLARAVDRHADIHTFALGWDAVRRSLVPSVVVVGTGLLVSSLDWPDPLVLVAGGGAAGVLAVVAALRWSLDPGERAEITSALRRRSAPEPTP